MQKCLLIETLLFLFSFISFCIGKNKKDVLFIIFSYTFASRKFFIIILQPLRCLRY